MPKIGFACKYVHPDRSLSAKQLKEIESRYNGVSTTYRWARENADKLEERLWDIADHNISCVDNLVRYVASLPPIARMLRISGDLFPLYTHPEVSWFYKQKSFQRVVSKRLLAIGDFARQYDVRLSMHPGQFVVLASHSPEIIESSIEEFEYHTDIIRWLGYGKTFQDFKCNIHLSGRGGEREFRRSFARLSPEAQNCITLENDEFGAGLQEVLNLADLCPTVLDVHHHWIRTGRYIQPNDYRVQKVVDSWRGLTPTMHYSYSREEVLQSLGHDDTRAFLPKPNMSKLQQKQKLRAHSDYYPNALANMWALRFIDRFDIMCESKMKNLAAKQLIDFYCR